jgi:hypothetical protein
MEPRPIPLKPSFSLSTSCDRLKNGAPLVSASQKIFIVEQRSAMGRVVAELDLGTHADEHSGEEV